MMIVWKKFDITVKSIVVRGGKYIIDFVTRFRDCVVIAN